MKTPIMLEIIKGPFLPLIAMAPLKFSQPPNLTTNLIVN
jgi:hypothetical protein